MLGEHGWRQGTLVQRVMLRVTLTSIRLTTRRIGPDSKKKRIESHLIFLLTMTAFRRPRKLASTSSQWQRSTIYTTKSPSTPA